MDRPDAADHRPDDVRSGMRTRERDSLSVNPGGAKSVADARRRVVFADANGFTASRAAGVPKCEKSAVENVSFRRRRGTQALEGR